jgi:hypothetical protein
MPTATVPMTAMRTSGMPTAGMLSTGLAMMLGHGDRGKHEGDGKGQQQGDAKTAQDARAGRRRANAINNTGHVYLHPCFRAERPREPYY